jgi:hypothetical protein
VTLQKFAVLGALGADQLHLTIQGIGFTDAVREDDVAAIVEATRKELTLTPRPSKLRFSHWKRSPSYV